MTGPDVLDSRYAWTRLAISLLIATVGNVGMWAIIVVMPAVQAEFGVDRADASLPYTLTMVGFALGNFAVGRIVDRWGITAALVMAAAMIAAGMSLSALSPSVTLLAAAQLLVGFGTAASFGPLIADVSLWFLKRRGIAVAITASGNYLSGAIWPVILAGVLAEQGWRAVYLALAVITVAVVIPLSMFLRRRVPLEARAKADAASDLRAKAAGFRPMTLAVLLGVAGIGCCVAMSMPQVHIVAFCVDLGYGPAVGGQMLSLMLLGGVVSRLISGLVADRLGGVMTLLIGSALQCLALFLYLPSGGMTSLYIVSLVFGLAQGGIVPSYALVVREYMPSAEAGRWVGFVLMSTIFGMALGGWMSGWIYDVTGSYYMAFVNGIVWNFLNIGIMVMILMRTRPRRPEAVAA
ncbi:MFS transporter [Roseovarius indicus]|uniref:MFS transporter n=1 Tax=Roseovarius indicus TaxID=540747 RepID=A0A0T5P254_9RHOB|nr:MFS transporter [Roseovarius indicus]KRS15156.1 MFS transporter [Roseovarius indicus]QEW24801.1 putative sulfoacetate transporter SauU [Roseovarius indicus]SFE51232.1 Cyanate permease [Roseovarius indicus]